MSAAGFNTLEAAEDLQAAGLDEAHAKAIVGTVHRAMTEGMATKGHVSAEVAGAEGRLRTEFAATRGHFDTELAAMRGHFDTGLAATRGHIDTEIAAAEGRLNGKIAAFRADMLKTSIGIVVTNVTITVALLKLIP